MSNERASCLSSVMMSAKLYWKEAVDSGQGHRKTIYDVFSNKRANTTPCTSQQFFFVKKTQYSLNSNYFRWLLRYFKTEVWCLRILKRFLLTAMVCWIRAVRRIGMCGSTLYSSTLEWCMNKNIGSLTSIIVTKPTLTWISILIGNNFCLYRKGGCFCPFLACLPCLTRDAYQDCISNMYIESKTNDLACVEKDFFLTNNQSIMFRNLHE